MVRRFGATEPQCIVEHAFSYLPRKPVQEFARKRVIYDYQEAPESIYLIIGGRAKVTTIANDGYEMIARIVCADDVFGEGALVGSLRRPESAVALDRVTLMAWTRDEVEQQIEREPRLGIALMRFLVSQCLALEERVASMAIYKTPERVMLALVQLAERLGAPLPDGSTRIAYLTHHTIADYVGTSREIVTFQMNRLRRMGLVRYSRKTIEVYTDAMKNALLLQGIHAPEVVGELIQRVGQ